MRPVQDWNKYVDMLGKAVQENGPTPAALPHAPPRRGRGPRREETREELLLRLLDPILTLEETARILEVCPATVRRYTNRGVLPHERSAGNQRRFKLSCVLEFRKIHPRCRDLSATRPDGTGGDLLTPDSEKKSAKDTRERD